MIIFSLCTQNALRGRLSFVFVVVNVRSGGLVETRNLADKSIYDVIEGEL